LAQIGKADKPRAVPSASTIAEEIPEITERPETSTITGLSLKVTLAFSIE